MSDKDSATGSRQARIAILLLLAGLLTFAVMDGLTKTLSQTVPIPAILWVRSIVFTLLALAFLLRRHRGESILALARSKRPVLQFSRALLLIIESGMFMLAFKLMPLADAHAIGAIAPLIVVALSVPLLKERVGPRRWAAVAVGFLGVMLIVRPGFDRIELPMLVALAGAAMWGVYQIMVRMVSRVDSNETTSLWTAAVGLAATSLVGPAVWVWPTGSEWVLLAVIALLGSFGHIALISALGMTQPARLQPFMYTLFVWAVVVGYVMFGDIPDRLTLIGAAIVIASGIYVWHRERVRASER